MGLGKTCQVFTTIIVSKLIFELQRDEFMSWTGKWSFVCDLLDQGALESAFQLYLYSKSLSTPHLFCLLSLTTLR